MGDRSSCRFQFAAKDRERVSAITGEEIDEDNEGDIEIEDAPGGGWNTAQALRDAHIPFVWTWDGCNGSYSAGCSYFDGNTSVDFATTEDADYMPMIAVGANLFLNKEKLSAFRRDLRIARSIRAYIDAN